MKYIRKRDGSTELYTSGKIITAINKAVLATGYDEETAYKAALTATDAVEQTLEAKGGIPSVEEVQDIVERALMDIGYGDVAKQYILYREKRSLARDSAESLNSQLHEIFDSSQQDSDLKRDNANVDGNSPMGTMLQVGAAASKNFYAKNFLAEKHRDLNKAGFIHIHDFDFYGLTMTCCQIDLVKLFKDGFSTGHGYIREPQSIQSYSSLACIAIQANQNDQHGGQGVPNFDYAMADGVRKTYVKEFVRTFTDAYEDFTELSDQEKFVKQCVADVERIYNVKPTMSDSSQFDEDFINAVMTTSQLDKRTLEKLVEKAHARAHKRTDKATHQAMESLIHNLNSMHSRAGAQTPFSSINYGTDTSLEGRMVIKNLLMATMEGLGGGETPIFPIQVFKVKDGVNYNEGDPNYDLFKQACRVSAKRLFPNFVFLDAPFNLQYYVPGKPETEVATMGCRTRVMSNVYDPTQEISHSRGNLSFTSINLPRLAILANGDTDKFFNSLNELMEDVAEQLYDRFELIAKRRVFNFPFLMGQGVWLDSEKLGPYDEVREVMKHGSLSIGFIGLAEALTALYGQHHGESEEMQEKGLEVIQFMRDFTDKKAKETGLNYSLLATPAEGLSGYFVRKDKVLYGEIPGVTDKEYYTNSFHIPVGFPISAFEKINKEAPYHALTNAGHISYVELDGNTSNNVEAFEAVIRCMHDAGIGYGSVNHPVDRDPVCGYVGIIDDVCPRCGRREGEGVSIETLLELKKKYPDVPVFKGIE